MTTQSIRPLHAISNFLHSLWIQASLASLKVNPTPFGLRAFVHSILSAWNNSHGVLTSHPLSHNFYSLSRSPFKHHFHRQGTSSCYLHIYYPLCSACYNYNWLILKSFLPSRLELPCVVFSPWYPWHLMCVKQIDLKYVLNKRKKKERERTSMKETKEQTKERKEEMWWNSP